MYAWFFFFFFFFFFCFLLCCALPRWSFCSSLFVPSYLAARPRRCWPCGVPGMRVRAYLSFPMRVGVSIGVLSVLPLVGFPCRCGFRCAFRGGALWRCLSLYLFCACYGVMHTTYGTYVHNILAFRRPVALLLLVCIFHARHSTYLGTCAASCSFCCDPLRAYFLHEWACIAWSCTWYVSTVVRFVTYVFSLSTSFRVVFVSLVFRGAWHITYLLVGGRWRCCCLCVGCFGARTSP